jgi:hypothetical protein
MTQHRDPMSRILDLETGLASVSKALEKLLDIAEKPVQQELPKKPRKQSLVMPLSHRNRDLALLAWGCLTEAGKAPPGTIKQAMWYEAIKELDAEGTFPSHCQHLGATLRATLAEQAGMNIRWSATTLWGANEPESMHFSRNTKEGQK